MWPAIIGAVGSIASGLLSNSQADSNAKESFQRQKELMALQQRYAVENWNREVNYNDPKQQMKRLKDAGLNPNLVYGNGASGLEAPQTAAPTAPSAPMAQPIPFGNFVMDAVEALKGIQLAKKTKEEGIGQQIKNEFDRKTFEDRVKSVGLQNNWTQKQIDEATERITNLQQEYGLLVAKQNILSTDRQIRDKELNAWDERFRKEMRKMDDEHNLSHEEYRRLRDTYDDFIKITRNAADKSEWEAKMAELLYNIDSDWKETEKKLGALGTLFKMLMRLAK